MNSLFYDATVIGSGPGGAITAWVLAKSGLSVLLLEEGQSIPVGSFPSYGLLDMETKYRQGGMTLALGKPNISYVEAQVVGGGSEINSGLYHRTPSIILEKWKTEFGLIHSESSDLEPYFKRCEDILNIGYQDSGTISLAAKKLQLGAERKGWQGAQIPRWIRDGKRYSMSSTFIPEAIEAGCTLKPRHRVRTIRRSNRGWTVAGVSEKNQIFECKSKTVFCCGGAVQTPFLLRNNGLSEKAGQQIQIHPSLKMVAEFQEEISDDRPDVPDYQVKEFAPEISFGCSISSPAHIAVALGGAPDNPVETFKRCAVYYSMVEDEAHGTVLSLPFSDRALLKYALSPVGVNRLRLGARKLAELLWAADAKKIYLSAMKTPQLTVDHFAKQTEQMKIETLRLMTIHLFSSCPMGENRKKTVTDSFGAVHDQPGLYINDASLLCTAPSVNPQGSVMAFAMRNAEIFVQNLKGKL